MNAIVHAVLYQLFRGLSTLLPKKHGDFAKPCGNNVFHEKIGAVAKVTAPDS